MPRTSFQFIQAYQFLRINEEGPSQKIVDEINNTLLRKNFPTNKITYNNIDEIWSIDLIDNMEYKVSSLKGFRYIFITIDTFSTYTWAIPLGNKNAQTMTNYFSNFLTTSKRSPVKIESDRGREFYNPFFQSFFRETKHYSRFTDKAPSIAERVIRTIGKLLKEAYIFGWKR